MYAKPDATPAKQKGIKVTIKRKLARMTADRAANLATVTKWKAAKNDIRQDQTGNPRRADSTLHRPKTSATDKMEGGTK